MTSFVTDNPIRKPLFMRVCKLSALNSPTVCPQEFFAHRLSLHLFYGLIISYFVEKCKKEIKEELKPVEEVELKEEPKMKDITIKCKKCEKEWVWTVKEQEFYKEKGFFKPSYCKDCRKKTKFVNNFHKDI